MRYEQIKLKASELFAEATFIIEIKNDDEYQQALLLMAELIEDYDKQRPLIEILSASIERWEDTANEFSEFNQRISELDDVSVLKLIMEQHKLGIADLPEVGSKTLV